MDTVENEHKVLDADPDEIARAMERIGAQQVYDGVRTITYFDHPDHSLRAAGEGVKLTEEDKIKLEYTRKSPNGQSDTVKLFVSRVAEATEFLKRMGLVPVTRVRARRISYELGSADFDIDFFPHIPPFMEIDLGDTTTDLTQTLEQLGLSDNKVIIATTPEIFAHYNRDYFVDFAIMDLGVDQWGKPSDAAATRLNKAAEDVKKGIDLSEPFTTVEEFMKDL